MSINLQIFEITDAKKAIYYVDKAEWECDVVWQKVYSLRDLRFRVIRNCYHHSITTWPQWETLKESCPSLQVEIPNDSNLPEHVRISETDLVYLKLLFSADE